MKLLLTCLLIFGCGQERFDKTVSVSSHNPRAPHIEKEFEPYVNKFFDLLGYREDIIVEFTNNDDYAGVCYYWAVGNNEIKVNRNYWEKINEKQREQLIFHELGHCVLNKDHNNDIIDINGFSCPYSIMRSWAFDRFEIEHCYNKDYQHYVRDLI
jgi:hypothetical protein